MVGPRKSSKDSPLIPANELQMLLAVHEAERQVVARLGIALG